MPLKESEEELGSALQLYPNPATDVVQISCAGCNGDVQLMNMGGQVVRSVIKSDDTVEISVDGLPTGVYVLGIRMDAGMRIAEKLIIQ